MFTNELIQEHISFFKQKGINIFGISSFTRNGISHLTETVLHLRNNLDKLT